MPTTAEVFCSGCGARGDPAATYCTRCGQLLHTPEPPAAQPSQRPWRWEQLTKAWARRQNGATPPVASPFSIHHEKASLTIPLRQSFRFVHEPLGEAVGALPFVGRDNELESLAERILFSEGGSFLVTGYRGVGKTSSARTSSSHRRHRRRRPPRHPRIQVPHPGLRRQSPSRPTPTSWPVPT